MDSIGNRIKQARLGQGLSQVELALATNVSQPTVANWENDSHIPRQGAIDRLVDILSTSANWIQIGDTEITNDVHNSAEYLTRPIQHIPVSAWPTTANIKDERITLSAVRDYMALSILADRPFALIANDPNMAAHFPIGVAIIFDATAGELEDGKFYLFAQDNEIILRRWQPAPNRLEAMSTQSAVDVDFIETSPVPLARAVMSIRRH